MLTSCSHNLVNATAHSMEFLNRNEDYNLTGCDAVKSAQVHLCLGRLYTPPSFQDRRVSEASRNTVSIFRARVNQGSNQQMQAASGIQFSIKMFIIIIIINLNCKWGFTRWQWYNKTLRQLDATHK
jgi:hypothetical protein